MAAPNSTSTIHPSNLATNQAIRLLAVATGVTSTQLVIRQLWQLIMPQVILYPMSCLLIPQ
jgi:hypothetical protein